MQWTIDGLTYTEHLRQEYSNGKCLSVGWVEGHDVDTMYIRWHTVGDETNGAMLLMRPDEMATVAWLASGILYTHLIG